VDGALAMPGFALNPGDKATKHFRIYSGRAEYPALRLLDNKEKDVSLRLLPAAFPPGPFSRMLLNSMNGIYALTGSYPLAIVLLTICDEGPALAAENRRNKTLKKMSASSRR